MAKGNKIIVSAVIVVMLVVVSLRTSYAFFTDNLSGNVTIDVLKTQNGEMRVSYQNNDNVFSLKAIAPSDDYVGEKTFSIATTNNQNGGIMVYKMALNVEYNSFENSDIYFILGGKNNDSGSISNYADGNTKHYLNRQIEGSYKVDLGSGYFNSDKDSEVHEYILRFFYPKKADNLKRNDRVLNTKIEFTSVN